MMKPELPAVLIFSLVAFMFSLHLSITSVEAVSQYNNTTQGFDGTTGTHSHVLGGSNRLLIVGVVTDNGIGINTATYSGTSMTKLLDVVHSGGKPRVALFNLTNPSTSGNNNIVVNLAAADKTSVMAVSYIAVDQTTSIDGQTSATGTSTAPSVSVTSAVGDLVQDIMGSISINVPTVGAGQTRIQTQEMGGTGASGHHAGESNETGAGSVSMDWTIAESKEWVILGFNINNAAAGTTFSRNATQELDITDAVQKILRFDRRMTNGISLTSPNQQLQSLARNTTNIIDLTEFSPKSAIFGKLTTLSTDVSDAIQTILTRVRLITNSIDITDAITRLLSFTRSLTNAIDLSEIVTKVVSLTRQFTNVIDLIDAVQRIYTAVRQLTNALDITDNIQIILTRVRFVTNVIDLTDVVTRIVSFTRALTNTFDLTEIMQTSLTRLRQLTNPITFVERITTAVAQGVTTVTRLVTQVLDLNDGLITVINRVRLIANIIDLTEVGERLILLIRTFTNAIDLTELIERTRIVPKIITQTLDLTETAQNILTRVRLIMTAIDLTESISRLASFTRFFTNAIDLTENITTEFGARVSRIVAQALDIADNISTLLTRVRLLINAIDLTEAITRLMLFTRNLVNAIDLTDAVQRIQTFFKTTAQALDIADNLQNMLTRVRLVTNTLDLTEVITRLLSFTRTQINSISLTTITTQITQFSRIITQSLDMIEVVIRLTATIYERIATLAIDLIDAVQKVRIVPKFITQSLDINEVTSRLLSFLRPITGQFTLTIKSFIPCPPSCPLVEAPPTTPSSEAGGRVYPSPSTLKSFLLDRDIIKVVLFPNDTDTQFLSVNNNGNVDLKFTVLIEGVERFMTVSDKEFTLKVGESKRILVKFLIEENRKPDVHTGRILVKGDSIEREVPIIIEIESPQPLFDIKIEIPDGFESVTPGKTTVIQLTLLNLGKGGRVDATVEYGLKDTLGNTIINQSEVIAVEGEISFTREIQIPSYLKDGTYIAFAKVSYGDQVGTSTSTFEVSGSELPKISLTGILIFLVPSSGVVVFAMHHHKVKKEEQLIRRERLKRLVAVRNSLHLTYPIEKEVVDLAEIRAELVSDVKKELIEAVKNKLKNKMKV